MGDGPTTFDIHLAVWPGADVEELVEATPQLLSSVVATIGSWLASSPRRSIRLELGGDVLGLNGVSSDEQRRLTNEWLSLHVGR